MIKVILFLAACLVAVMGLSWLADNPGTVSIEWPALNLKAEPSIFQVFIGLILLVLTALVTWSLLRNIWHSPAHIGGMLHRRRQERGLDALSSGMIAIGAGDRDSATRYAIQARKALPNEPLTHLLRAQAAQLSGDATTSRRIFEAMLASPDTEQLGLRGLFVEAQREAEPEAARQFASRALKLNPKLAWASDALFDIQCKSGDFDGALETLAVARRHNHIEKGLADRRRAVLLTGLATKAEDGDPVRALNLATEAHALAPDLVPAANLAGRMYAARGNTAKAAKIIQKTWSRCPHPDLATAYAFARIGDSPRDRLERVRQLAELNPHSPESAIAIANAAIDAKAFDDARAALEPMLESNLSQRIATLMARIESEQHGDKGRVREWLARAVNAPRDPAWTADNIVSETWAPVSPVTGQIDAFQWRVPGETVGGSDTAIALRKIEELVALGAPIADETADAHAGPHAMADAKGDTKAQGDTKSQAAAAAQVAPAKPEGPSPHMAPAAKPAIERTAPLAEVVTPGDAEPKAASAPTMSAPRSDAANLPPRGADTAASAAPLPSSAPSSTAKPATPTPPARPSAEPVIASAASPATLATKPATSAATPLNTASPAPQPTAHATAAKPAQKPADPSTKEPRIFVVPHAPDDPGPDGADADQTGKPRPPYRAIS